MPKKLLCLLLILVAACVLAAGALAKEKAEEEPDPALEAAIAANQQLINSCWQGVVAEGAATDARYIFVDALGAWMFDHADAKLSEDGNVAILVLPNLNKAALNKLPQYKGEEPILYLRDLAAGIETQIAALPAGETVEIAIPASGELPESDSGYLTAMRILAEETGTAWVAKVLKTTKGYGALSRLLLDDGQEAAFWKNINFAQKDQVPAYAKNAGYKLLKKGSSGAGVKKAQQALMDQGFFEGKIDGSYGSGTAEAVERYQRANALLVNGELSPEQQSLLYGDPDPMYLSSTLQGAVGDQYWGAFLHMLRNINWDGDSFSYQAETYIDTDALYEKWLSEYLAANAPKAEMASIIPNLHIKGGYLPETEDGDEGGEVELTTYTMYIPLDTFLAKDVDAESILPADGVDQMRALYTSFAADLEIVLDQASEYAENNLEPIPMPKSSFLSQPDGGKAQIAYANKSAALLFVKVYKVSDLFDYSTDNLVATAFVRPKERAVIRLQPGIYHTRVGFGFTWYGERYIFGEDEACYLTEEAWLELENYYNSAYVFEGNTELEKNYRLTYKPGTNLNFTRENIGAAQAFYGLPLDEF